ncbi:MULTISPECIES: hypothetical protein [unclassified Novosphingobium]|uniref:hypothetical protein n=1 Tax=unclassified Novosphingobium TaxID=2644732 RepID=UPI0013596623|nr:MULTISPECIES: hypothetical protein [unclassified Novosphingobium]
MKNISGLLLVGCSALALAGCGPSDIASPGTGGDVIITPSPTPTPAPTPTPGEGLMTPAGGCPTVANDAGTVTGPTGTWRVCNLPNVISASSTLPKIAGLIYQLPGRVDVGCDGGFTAPTSTTAYTTTTVGCPTSTLTADTNVTLTIAPGVIIMGGTGQSWLAVNRGNKINAAGTAEAPIIFTSRDNVLGINNDNSQGQWGGVVLMGRAPVTDCTVGTLASGTCERQTEGAPNPARFGGADSAYNAGVMKYFQIRYSGFILGNNIELQSLTGEGIGTGTTIDHFQSVNSSDDGSEWFGGSPRMKYYISVGSDDDSLDVDTGAQMLVQYALIAQRAGFGDGIMEIDSDGNASDAPRTNLTVANFTFLKAPGTSGSTSNGASLFFRGNSDTTLVNGLLVAADEECVRINTSAPTPVTLTARSVVMQCNAAKYLGSNTSAGVVINTAAQSQAAFNPGNFNNRDDFTNTLTSTFINGANENAVVATDPKSLVTGSAATFFDTTTWIGAVRNAADNWYAGWTCNSATANFGTGNSGNCTSLPTT